MNIGRAITIVTAVQFLASGAGLAEDRPASSSDSSTQTATPAGAPQSSQPVAMPPKAHKSIFLSAISIIPATLIGTPVNWISKPIDEDKYTIAQATNNSHNPKQTVPAGILWAPLAMISGVLEAPFFALDNALRHCDKPFSKAQFSLTEGDTTTNDPIKGQSAR